MNISWKSLWPTSTSARHHEHQLQSAWVEQQKGQASRTSAVICLGQPAQRPSIMSISCSLLGRPAEGPSIINISWKSLWPTSTSARHHEHQLQSAWVKQQKGQASRTSAAICLGQPAQRPSIMSISCNLLGSTSTKAKHHEHQLEIALTNKHKHAAS